MRRSKTCIGYCIALVIILTCLTHSFPHFRVSFPATFKISLIEKLNRKNFRNGKLAPHFLKAVLVTAIDNQKFFFCKWVLYSGNVYNQLKRKILVPQNFSNRIDFSAINFLKIILRKRKHTEYTEHFLSIPEVQISACTKRENAGISPEKFPGLSPPCNTNMTEGFTINDQPYRYNI